MCDNTKLLYNNKKSVMFEYYYRYKDFFMASGGLYSIIYITFHSPYKSYFCAMDTLNT